MKIETPWHAEHQLDQLAAQFEHWRQTRTHPGERFPPALWDQAVADCQRRILCLLAPACKPLPLGDNHDGSTTSSLALPIDLLYGST